jgi:caffeoyl-CoA O-methyltransferase
MKPHTEQAALQSYVEQTVRPEDDALLLARERVSQHKLPRISVSPMDGRHLQLLAQSIGAKKAVEIGTLGGYSAICIARGLQEGGRLYTWEINPVNARIARTVIAEAGLSSRVTVHVGDAVECVDHISHEAPFDFIFLDGNKEEYVEYWQWASENIRPGGLIVADNTFAFGKAHLDDFPEDMPVASIRAVQRFNEMVARDTRFLSTVFPTNDGLTVALRLGDS